MREDNRGRNKAWRKEQEAKREKRKQYDKKREVTPKKDSEGLEWDVTDKGGDEEC